jgi:hypothetical protein
MSQFQLQQINSGMPYSDLVTAIQANFGIILNAYVHGANAMMFTGSPGVDGETGIRGTSMLAVTYLNAKAAYAVISESNFDDVYANTTALSGAITLILQNQDALEQLFASNALVSTIDDIRPLDMLLFENGKILVLTSTASGYIASQTFPTDLLTSATGMSRTEIATLVQEVQANADTIMGSVNSVRAYDSELNAYYYVPALSFKDLDLHTSDMSTIVESCIWIYLQANASLQQQPVFLIGAKHLANEVFGKLSIDFSQNMFTASQVPAAIMIQHRGTGSASDGNKYGFLIIDANKLHGSSAESEWTESDKLDFADFANIVQDGDVLCISSHCDRTSTDKVYGKMFMSKSLIELVAKSFLVTASIEAAIESPWIKLIASDKLDLETVLLTTKCKVSNKTTVYDGSVPNSGNDTEVSKVKKASANTVLHEFGDTYTVRATGKDYSTGTPASDLATPQRLYEIDANLVKFTKQVNMLFGTNAVGQIIDKSSDVILKPRLFGNPADTNSIKDFNQLTDPGLWYCPTDSWVAAMSNKPIDPETGSAISVACAVLVERHVGLKQTVTTFQTTVNADYPLSVMLYRNIVSGTYGAWVSVGSSGRAISKIKQFGQLVSKTNLVSTSIRYPLTDTVSGLATTIFRGNWPFLTVNDLAKDLSYTSKDTTLYISTADELVQSVTCGSAGNTATIYALAVYGNIAVAALSNNTIYKVNLSDSTSTLVNSFNEKFTGLATNASGIVACTVSGKVYITTDGETWNLSGTTFTPSGVGQFRHTHETGFLDNVFSMSDYYYLTSGTGVYRSSNGLVWTQIATLASNSFVHCNNASYAYFLLAGGTLVTMDSAGTTATKFSSTGFTANRLIGLLGDFGYLCLAVDSSRKALHAITTDGNVVENVKQTASNYINGSVCVNTMHTLLTSETLKHIVSRSAPIYPTGLLQ